MSSVRAAAHTRRAANQRNDALHAGLWSGCFSVVVGVLGSGVPMCYFMGGPLAQFAVGLSALVCLCYAGMVGAKVVGIWRTIGRVERMRPLHDALQRGTDIAWIDGELDCPEPVAEPMAGQPCVYFHYVLKDNSDPENTATVVQNIQQFARCWIVQGKHGTLPILSSRMRRGCG